MSLQQTGRKAPKCKPCCGNCENAYTEEEDENVLICWAYGEVDWDQNMCEKYVPNDPDEIDVPEGHKGVLSW